MRILFVPSCTLNKLNSETTQFAAAVNIYTSFATIDVITDCSDTSILSKAGFSYDVNFEYVEQLNDIDIYKKIIKLDNELNYDYIISSNIQLLELIYNVSPQMLMTKVISSIMTECTDFESTIKVLNKSKGVQMPSNTAFEYFKSRGLKNSNCFIELPIVNYVDTDNSNKIYDMIFVGEMSDDNQTNDFFSIVSRYPDKKFAIVYTEYTNKISFTEDEFISYGLNNFKNLRVFNELSNEQTLQLIAQSKYTFALKTTVIETDVSTIPASKIIEGIATNTYPIVKRVKLNEELLGTDYPYYYDSLNSFNFGDYTCEFGLHYDNLTNSEELQDKLKLQYKPNHIDNNNVYISEIPTLSQAINLFDLNVSIVTDIDEVFEYLKQFNLRTKKIDKHDVSQYVAITEIESQFTKYNEFENTILVPLRLKNKIELHGLSLKNFNIINEQNVQLDVKQINKLANSKFHFIVSNRREMLMAMNIIGQLECDYINFNIVTKFDNECVVSKAMTFNRSINNSIELGLNNYNVNQLYQLASGQDVKCYKYNASNLVLVNNIYPSYENIYAHAYVHTRTKLYKKQGVNPIVVINTNGKNAIEAYVYDNQMVIKCTRKGFNFLFGKDKDYIYGIHFINQYIYNTLQHACPQNKKVVWFHGSDSLPASTRAEFYDLNNKAAYEAYSRRNNGMKIQDRVLKRIFENSTYHSVFVSAWLKSQISERYKLSDDSVSVIPNSIDTNTFYFEPKKVESDEYIKFLTIKPFLLEYDIYANQILVDAIKMASKEEWFKKCQFTIYGRGDGFNYYMNQLNQLNSDNIKYYQTFLSHAQIKKLHSKHHVYLHPNNQDTHGVSFFEAMSSGLVGINSDNSAKTEYCDSGVTSYLHKDQDAKDLCKVMGEVVLNYNDLDNLRIAGHQSVLDQFGESHITEKELELLFGHLKANFEE